jgi:hypothetical protein
VPPPSNAQPLFDMNVAPIIMADCSNATCHGGTGSNPIKFAAAPQAQLYASVLNYTTQLLGGNFDKTQAQILTKIAAGHNAVVYTAAQVTAIGDWLDAERTARAGSTTPTISPRDALLMKWSGCMDLNDWTTNDVGEAWGQKRTDTTNTACQQCHINGQGWLADGTNGAGNQRIFNILTTQKNPAGGYWMEYYFTVDTTDPANLKMVINTDKINRAGGGFAQHEKFTLDNDNNGNNPTAMQRLQTFFDKTNTKLLANTCGAPTLPSPSPAP